MVDKKEKVVICTSFSNGKCHDFKLFKESRVRFHPKTKSLTDSGYQGIEEIHSNTQLPKKENEKKPFEQTR